MESCRAEEHPALAFRTTNCTATISENPVMMDGKVNFLVLTH